jgi:hypothetical protein
VLLNLTSGRRRIGSATLVGSRRGDHGREARPRRLHVGGSPVLPPSPAHADRGVPRAGGGPVGGPDLAPGRRRGVGPGQRPSVVTG